MKMALCKLLLFYLFIYLFINFYSQDLSFYGRNYILGIWFLLCHAGSSTSYHLALRMEMVGLPYSNLYDQFFSLVRKNLLLPSQMLDDNYRLSWRDHIVQIAKSASKKLGVFFQCKQNLNSGQLFKLYTGFIHPCLEYCSHIWGSSPYTSLLDRVESKVIHLIGDPSLPSTLDPLSLPHKVASISLFYRYYFGHCSDELAACIPPPMARPHSTRQATFPHNYCVELSNARINRFSDGFFPSTSTFGTLPLLYSRLSSIFFPSKGRSITTLGTRWHYFFIFFKYFINLSYSFHYLFFILTPNFYYYTITFVHLPTFWH